LDRYPEGPRSNSRYRDSPGIGNRSLNPCHQATGKEYQKNAVPGRFMPSQEGPGLFFAPHYAFTAPAILASKSR
jgi:hypothetical protein